MLRGELDALRIEGRYPYRHVLALWFEAQLKSPAHFEQLSIVIEKISGEQEVDDLHGFLESRQRWIEFHAVEMFDDLRAAGTQAHNHSAIGKLIERPEMLRQCRRRPRVDVDDRGGELNPAGLFRDRREHSTRVASP